MHDHDHGHDHGGHHERPASQPELRARALEALLVERGLVSTDAIDAVVSYYENDVGPQNGARVIARAWVDPEYKARLLSDGSPAIAELGFAGVEGEHMVVVENTPSVHNVIVCTLCSCYPWPVLGLPPTWYKSYAYRARVVARVGLECGGALPRAARAPRGHRRPERGAARRARHAGRDDRRCARRGTREREAVSTGLAEVDAALSGYAPLPRLNGELVFDEAWHGRVLGMGVVVLEQLELPWSSFRDHLVAAIERHGQPEGESAAEAYYVAFLDAVESLVAAQP
jgi:nitrile hydratase